MRRQLEAVECLQALLALDDLYTSRRQRVGEENGGAFAHPGEAGFLRRIVERYDNERPIGGLGNRELEMQDAQCSKSADPQYRLRGRPQGTS